MLNIKDLSRIKGFRFPQSMIGCAVWAYHRFALSLREVEGRLAERGVSVSDETFRDWMNWFGHQFAAKIRRDRSAPADKWHLDEVVIQSRRNNAAALRFLRKLMKRWGQPRCWMTQPSWPGCRR